MPKFTNPFLTESLLKIGRRLEAATSRLEDMVPTMGDSSAVVAGVPQASDQNLSSDRGVEQGGGAATSPHKQMETLPPAIDDFDAIINGQVKSFVNISEEIGGLVAEQV